MGSVFLVRGTDGRDYALKTIRPEQVTEQGIVDRFIREIRIAALLNHPNIVKTYRAEQTATGTFYMMSEYCPGESAEQWLQNRGPLSPELALRWITGVARAIEYAWGEHRLVHRDIKPDNVLFDAHGQPKLTDFGIAKRVLFDEHKLTSAGTVVGSVPYMAPEQALGPETVDTRADLYALGSTFFELLAGAPPFDGPTPTALLSRKLTDDPPRLLSVRAEVPVAVAESVDWLLRREPGERPRDATQLLGHLDRVAQHENYSLESG
jgi:serine/threonine protein kinase